MKVTVTTNVTPPGASDSRDSISSESRSLEPIESRAEPEEGKKSSLELTRASNAGDEREYGASWNIFATHETYCLSG